MLELKQLLHGFSSKFTSKTTKVKSDIESLIEILVGFNSYKVEQVDIIAKHSTLMSKIEEKVKTWVSICDNIVSVAPLPKLEKLAQGKMNDECVRQVCELNLQVHGLSSIVDPSIVKYYFLKDQMDISNITLDKC